MSKYFTRNILGIMELFKSHSKFDFSGGSIDLYYGHLNGFDLDINYLEQLPYKQNNIQIHEDMGFDDLV